MRAAPLAAVLVLATGCSLAQFDELRDRAWADSSSAPEGADGEDYPIALAALTTDRPGLHAVALSGAPLGISTTSYDLTGAISSRGIALEADEAGRAVTLVSATDAVTGANGAVVVAGVGTREALFLYDGRTGSVGPELRRVIESSECAAGLSAFGRHMVYTPTALGDPDQPDLVLSADSELIVFPDLTPTSTGTCVRCTLGARPIRSIAAVELDGAAGQDLVVGVDSGILAFSALWIASNDGRACADTQTGFLGDIPLGEAAGVEHGSAIAAGDEDATFHKLAIWAPAMARVFVYRGLGASGPVGSANTTSIIVDGASPSFGSTLAFADLDRDGVDELVIGDPGATVNDVLQAGQVTVFKLNESDPFTYERLLDLHDAQPEAGQRMGRVLTIAEFVGSTDDADTLLIGAAYELFTYFQVLAGSPDVRE